MFKSRAENLSKNIHTFVDDPTIPGVEEESNVDEDDEISVVTMDYDFYGDNIDVSKEVE